MTVFEVDVDGRPPTVDDGPAAPGSPVWVSVRPDLRRIHVLAGDVMGAFGKSRNVAGKGRNEHQDVTHAVAWLQAYGTPALVLIEAQRLHHLILRSAVQLAEAASVDLWLLHRGERSDVFDGALRRHAAVSADVEMVPPQERRQTVSTPANASFPAVVRDDFHAFLSTCRRRLPAEHTSLIARRLEERVHVYAAAFPGADPDRATADLLEEILASAPGDDELIVDVRALQIAAWNRDLYIKVDIERLLHSEERPTVSPATAARRMTVYRQPYRSVVVALTHRGYGLTDISEITVDQAAAEGGTITVAGTAEGLEGELAIALRAARFLRVNAGAAGADQLFPHTDVALARALNEAVADVGIHVHGRRAERTRPMYRSWLARFGLSVHALP